MDSKDQTVVKNNFLFENEYPQSLKKERGLNFLKFLPAQYWRAFCKRSSMFLNSLGSIFASWADSVENPQPRASVQLKYLLKFAGLVWILLYIITPNHFPSSDWYRKGASKKADLI